MFEILSPMWLAWEVVPLINFRHCLCPLWDRDWFNGREGSLLATFPHKSRWPGIQCSDCSPVPLISPVRWTSKWSDWLSVSSVRWRKSFDSECKAPGLEMKLQCDVLNFLKNKMFFRRQCDWICILLLFVLSLFLWGPSNCLFNRHTRTILEAYGLITPRLLG